VADRKANVDTSVLVRYLTLDPADQGELARSLIEDDSLQVLVPNVALAETAYTLWRRYGIERTTVVDLLVDLISRENVDVQELPKALAIEALLLCRPSGRVSFADALIWAVARQSSSGVIYTFDRAFPASGVDRRVLLT
jgi:predicted nucleic acid-binding protein